jgi:hypothetical protein
MIPQAQYHMTTQPVSCRWVPPQSLPQEDQRIIKALQRIVECKSMADHREVGLKYCH